MTHHSDPEFNGFRECNYCGDVHFIDDLDTDLLCTHCATGKCGLCGDTFKKSELVEDHEHGQLCQPCTEEVTEIRASRFIEKIQVSMIVHEIMQEL